MLSKRNKIIIASVSGLVAVAFLAIILLATLGVFNISASELGKCRLAVVNNTAFANGYMTDSSGNVHFALDKGTTQRIVLEPSNATGCLRALSSNAWQYSDSNPTVAKVPSARVVRLVGSNNSTLALDINIVGIRAGASAQITFSDANSTWSPKIFVNVVAKSR